MKLINDLDVSIWCTLLSYFGAAGWFWGGGFIYCRVQLLVSFECEGGELLCSTHPGSRPFGTRRWRSKLAPGQFVLRASCPPPSGPASPFQTAPGSLVAWGMPCSGDSSQHLQCKKPALMSGLLSIGSLAVNYSRMASATLPSSRLRFTSEFGMDSGGSTALLPPGKNCFYVFNKQADSNSLSHHTQTPWALYG